MKTFVTGLGYAAASGLYWWMVTVVSYALFGGSTRPGSPPPSESYALATTVATIAVSMIVYALLFTMLRSILARSRSGTAGS